MAEVKQMGTQQVQCWQCKTVIYKGAKGNCPKCGAPSPAADIPKLRKVAPVLLRVGVPVGIVLIIVGFVMLMKGASGFFEIAMQGKNPMVGISIAGLVLTIGFGGIIWIGVLRSFLKKVDRATQEEGKQS